MWSDPVSEIQSAVLNECIYVCFYVFIEGLALHKLLLIRNSGFSSADNRTGAFLFPLRRGLGVADAMPESFCSRFASGLDQSSCQPPRGAVCQCGAPGAGISHGAQRREGRNKLKHL